MDGHGDMRETKALRHCVDKVLAKKLKGKLADGRPQKDTRVEKMRVF
jgi:hypothetical protein